MSERSHKLINRNTYPREALKKADKILELREVYGISITDLAKRFSVGTNVIGRVMTIARKKRSLN